MIYEDLKETEIMKINAAKHDFFNVNIKIDSFFISVYTQNYNSLKFKTLVTEFKNHYKTNLHSKQLFSSQMSFAATLQEQTQSSQKEKFTDKSSSSHINKQSNDHKDNECSSSCNQHSS